MREQFSDIHAWIWKGPRYPSELPAEQCDQPIQSGPGRWGVTVVGEQPTTQTMGKDRKRRGVPGTRERAIKNGIQAVRNWRSLRNQRDPFLTLRADSKGRT
ncbi:hypothetical protein GCM10017784_21190 [Deinococcus indicus]|nr:hypothetical protein GCM10017784_21190 [Deinococcus indicus]